jgi:hypothetical protein
MSPLACIDLMAARACPGMSNSGMTSMYRAVAAFRMSTNSARVRLPEPDDIESGPEPSCGRRHVFSVRSWHRLPPMVVSSARPGISRRHPSSSLKCRCSVLSL